MFELAGKQKNVLHHDFVTVYIVYAVFSCFASPLLLRFNRFKAAFSGGHRVVLYSNDLFNKSSFDKCTWRLF
jgi:hypothetical protein